MNTIFVSGARLPRRFLLVATMGILIAGVPAIASAAGTGEIPEWVIVARNDSGITNISATDLRRLFLAQVREASGNPIKVINLADPELKFAFLKKLTGMDRREIEMHFVALELRGQGAWPAEVASGNTLMQLFMQSKKIVGWMPSSELDELPERTRLMMTVVTVDGKNRF